MAEWAPDVACPTPFFYGISQDKDTTSDNRRIGMMVVKAVSNPGKPLHFVIDGGLHLDSFELQVGRRVTELGPALGPAPRKSRRPGPCCYIGLDGIPADAHLPEPAADAVSIGPVRAIGWVRVGARVVEDAPKEGAQLGHAATEYGEVVLENGPETF